MAGDYDDDRPKKSWREIDQQRDRSAHGRGEKPPGGPTRRTQRSQAYRSYKSQLNKLFDGGEVPEALKTKLAGAGVLEDAQQKKAARAEILAASKEPHIAAALSTYRKAFGFPEDEEVLAKLLDLTDEDVVSEAIQTIERLREEGRLKRSQSFKGRLQTVQMTIDEPEVASAAKALLRKL